jgi:hypothetical protein
MRKPGLLLLAAWLLPGTAPPSVLFCTTAAVQRIRRHARL